MAKFDAVADMYDASRGGLERGSHFADQLAGFLPDGCMRLLEVGVGTAAVAMPLARKGYEVLGTDISAPMLASASRRLAGRVVLADAAATPFSDGAFDAVYAAWVMYHLADPEAALAEAGRVLRPGGRFLAMDRNRIDGGRDPWADLGTEIDRRLGRERLVLRSHYEEFAQLADAYGLSLVGIMATEPWREERTLRQAVDNARRRVFGWDGTEAEWDQVVEPLLDELAVRPDIDDLVVFAQGHEVLVVERR